MELPGTVALDDGRYMDSGPGGPHVLAVETEGAMPPARRKRRRPRSAPPERGLARVPVTVATIVFAGEPLDRTSAGEWLRQASLDPRAGELIRDGLAVLERGVAAACATTGRAIGEPAGPERLLAVRIGYGEGERVYEGRFLEAMDVDPGGGAPGPRGKRLDRIVPLPRIVSILAGREPILACEVMIPRVRADLDSGRLDPAALTVGEAVRATVAELEFALEDPEHEVDLDRLEELLPDLLAIPAELFGDRSPPAGSIEREQIRGRVGSALEVAERAIRRYRISGQ